VGVPGAMWGRTMRARTVSIPTVMLASVLAWGLGMVNPASAGSTGFSSEQPAGTPLLHQSNWEPTVATDPNHPGRVYQLITGINAHQCSPGCPGTSVLFRASTDGGTTWGPQQFVCGLGCQGVGWQFDPQIKVAADTNSSCGCGTIYVAFLNTYDPGVVLFKSHDGGVSWQGPITMNGSLIYMDKPVLVISPTGRDVYVAFNGKLASYVVASHDFGDPGTFLPPRQVNGDDDLWWYPDGGAIAPNGTVYFGENGESGSQLNVGHLNGPAVVGVFRCAPSSTSSCAAPALTSFGTSAAPPPCLVFQCYPDYYDATPSVAIDSVGHIVVAYTFTTVPGGPKSLYVSTSNDGVSWSPPKLLNHQGDSNVPQIANGPAAGDFRLAWQDNRTGAFNTWYAASSDGGASWSKQVKLSNLTSGAPYKSDAGYTFTDGDYFGVAVSSVGVTYAIWGEADGSSIYCCGDVWYTKGS
jgi:hypothetical protein